MEISFLPGRISSLTLSFLMSSVLTINEMNNYVGVHACVCILGAKHMQWNSKLEQVLLLGTIVVLLTLSFLVNSTL